MIKLLIGGSPCTHWSIAQSKNRETKAEGIGWELFLNYVIAKEKFKPDFFLYENNWSASKEIKKQIQHELGQELMRINSSLVSAQNRDKFYVFNWQCSMPNDKGILLSDVLESGMPVTTTNKGKSFCISATEYKGSIIAQTLRRRRRTLIAEPVNDNRGKRYQVENNFLIDREHLYHTILPDGYYRIRKLTPVECERLQTLPDGYTAAVSDTQRYKGLGNGWTAEVIIHILQGALQNVPRDEKIVVLSMYDGIGTGRYCLEKMGFTNVEYHAYEIDKYAIKVAMSNYPDIIQHGDAFQVREDGWSLSQM